MLCYGLLFVMWCDAQQPAATPDAYCAVAKPIMWSGKDTRETKEQVDTHNRTWKAICRGAK